MRDLNQLNQFRDDTGLSVAIFGSRGDHSCGAFKIKSPIDGAAMVVVASSDGGWDHVSVSRRNRCPNWTEMSHIKRLFFRPDETVMQLHVPDSDHVNLHPYCLHLWRPHHMEIPRPPHLMVGPKAMGAA